MAQTMLLAVDIGNSNIVFGVHNGKRWINHWRIQTAHQRLADEYSVQFSHLISESALSFADFDQIIVSSVVPLLTSVIVKMLTKRCAVKPEILSHRTKTGIQLATCPPENTGADLIAGAVAAYHRVNDDCIVIDFGTATTLSAIKKPGVFLGAAIAAGLEVTLHALINKASQLADFPLEAPPATIGNCTQHALQSGLLIGHIAMIEGLVTRMKHELANPDAAVIATGGLAHPLSKLSDVFTCVDPWLTLEGLYLIAQGKLL